MKEETSLAKLYKNKSVAEQNSVDLAWEVLMTEDYKELRNAICATKSERRRFRQVCDNSHVLLLLLCAMIKLLLAFLCLQLIVNGRLQQQKERTLVVGSN